jgi:ATP-dependent DNA ligase
MVRRKALAYVEHVEDDVPTIFRAACRMGLEGIVSKRKGSRYISGRSPDWRKTKNPACAALTRENEEEWGKRSVRRRLSAPLRDRRG